MSQLQEMQITSPIHFNQQQISHHHMGSESHLTSDNLHSHLPYVSHGQTSNSPTQYNTITNSSLSEYCTPNSIWSPLSTSLIYNQSLTNNNNNNSGG